MAMPAKFEEQGHYKVLALPSTESLQRELTKQEIKLAYRRALLLHHPDKSLPAQCSKLNSAKPTIDQITIAYKTLIDHIARTEYDRLVALSPHTLSRTPQAVHPGLEAVDLDDLFYDERHGVWYRSCRCGKERAYAITEEDLEGNAEFGELVVGCQGCSLWLRVTFTVVEDG